MIEGALLNAVVKGAIGLGGVVAAIIAAIGLYWVGKRSGRKDERSKIDAERYERTERARDIEDDVNRGGPSAARDSLRDRVRGD